MSSTISGGKITFSYTKNEIFNKCCLLSAYMTKNLKDGDQSAMDDYSMTDDEENMFLACLESSMPDTWEAVLKITSGVQDAYYIEDTTAPAEGDNPATTAGDVTIKIQDNGAYNGNAVTLVDASFKNCIIYGVLRDYYATNVHNVLLKLAAERYAAELAKLGTRLFQLKKKSLV